MIAGDIIGEIHRIREKLAAECGFDPKKIGERLRQQQREREREGVKYVSFAPQHPSGLESSLVREESAEPADR